MSLSLEQVEHVAYLARLGLSEAEKQHLAEQLSHILDTMQLIDQLDTSAIPPTAQVIPLSNVMREDEPRPSLPTDQVLANAPRREGPYVVVPPVLE
jgi:aspartyl-tRNA(Asn)/glutamyl-tRNA(Gln) amidotransferase subunit C